MLLDCGLAEIFNGFATSKFVGSFRPPEIKSGYKAYTPQGGTSWCLGISLFYMLFGFYIVTEQDNFCHAKFYQSIAKLSPECRNLLTKLFCKDPKYRITPAEILRHKWLVE